MKRVSRLAVLVLVLAVGVLPAAAITGGGLDGEGHPNVGLMIADVDGEPAWRCTGTLIAPRVFLTAGHCVGDGATAARVWFDTDLTDNAEYPDGGETSIEGTPIPHPDYGLDDANPYDVGVVILDEAVTDIAPAQMPDPDLLAQLKADKTLRAGGPEGATFTVVGYGGTLETWPPPVLAYDRIRRVATSEYVALTPFWVHLSQKAVFEESGTCFGDSGGPTYWVDGEDEVLVALTSTGDAQCVATGLNYRVDVPEILEWIESQLPEG